MIVEGSFGEKFLVTKNYTVNINFGSWVEI